MLIPSLIAYSRALTGSGFELAVKPLSATIFASGGDGIGSGSCTWASQSGEKLRGSSQPTLESRWLDQSRLDGESRRLQVP